MNLSSCKNRVLFVLSVSSFVIMVNSPSRAEIVNYFKEYGSRRAGSFDLIRSSFAGGGNYGSVNSFSESFAVTMDTVANTASFTAMHYGNATVAGGGTRTKSSTTVTPPTDFPDPPTTNTATFTETVTFDPIMPADVSPRFVSSTVGAITYRSGYRYRFPSNVAFEFPDSFTVSGTYKMQGPTETAIVPFSMLYSRVGSANVLYAAEGIIDVGTSFPDTADVIPLVGASVIYRAANRVLFNGTVDGQQFNVVFLDARISAALPIPEPTTCLYVVLAGWLIQPRRRRGSPAASRARPKIATENGRAIC